MVRSSPHKKSGVIIFSESKSFPTEAMAKSWAERLGNKVRDGGAPKKSMTVDRLIEMHLEYQQKLRPLGRSTIHNHQVMASVFAKIAVDDLTTKHITDYVLQRRAEGAGPATILANLSPVSAALHGFVA